MRGIVVGVRGGDDVDPALDLALEEALRRRLPLEALHCFEVTGYGVEWPHALLPTQVRHRREQAQRTVDEALAAARRRVPGGATALARATVREGPPAAGLLAAGSSAALVVVGTRGGGALRRGLRGSVSAEVLHRSWAPVAVVPRSVPAVHDRWARSRVVTAVDGGPASLAALSWAVTQAHEWGSVLMPVVVSPVPGRPPAALLERSSDLPVAVWSAVHDAGGATLEVHPRFLEGPPVEELLSLVEPEDLLVLGSRGRRGVPSLVLGSTSTAVAEGAHCAVVVVREGQSRRETHQRAHSSGLSSSRL